MTPTFPRTGTDAHRLLVAMLTSTDARAWNVNSRLHIIGNSRASDLRALGWHVQSINAPALRKGGRRRWGYQLTSVKQIADGRATLSRQAAA